MNQPRASKIINYIGILVSLFSFVAVILYGLPALKPALFWIGSFSFICGAALVREELKVYFRYTALLCASLGVCVLVYDVFIYEQAFKECLSNLECSTPLTEHLKTIEEHKQAVDKLLFKL
jgi:hypothetical protein